jgi:hypothetical protein
VVVRHVTSDAFDQSKLEKEISDPLVRDTALAAVERLAPSKRRHTSLVGISGRALGLPDMAPLSLESREILAGVLRVPVVRASEAIEGRFVGTVREIDLDARRFELRQVIDSPEAEIRCAYPELYDAHAKNWLDAKVHVRGPVVRDVRGAVRMLQIVSLDLVEARSTEENTEDAGA